MASIAGRPRPPLTAERRFYLGMAAAVIVVVFAGFAPSYYLRGAVPPYAPALPMTPLVHLHGALFTIWVLLFATQAGLVSSARVDLHRRLGLIGFVMVAALAVVGTLAALHGVARASGPPIVSPLSWLAVPLLDVPVFAGLIAAALLQRRNPQTHKRLMLAAMIAMLPPAASRIPLLGLSMPVKTFAVMILFLGALALWDIRSRGRVHKATAIAAAVLVGSWIFRLAVWETGPWLAFARWASSLVA